jgi:hypothetical protein
MPGDVFRNMSGPASWGVSLVLGLAGALVGYVIFTLGLGIGDTDIFDWGGLLSVAEALPLEFDEPGPLQAVEDGQQRHGRGDTQDRPGVDDEERDEPRQDVADERRDQDACDHEAHDEHRHGHAGGVPISSAAYANGRECSKAIIGDEMSKTVPSSTSSTSSDSSSLWDGLDRFSRPG